MFFMPDSSDLVGNNVRPRALAESPRVSIVTPVYNSEKYLKFTVESVLSQTYPNIEYIVIDGGSKDNSVEIIKGYGDRVSYWVSEPDAGMYDAINKGLKLASGDIFAYLNSDDLYCPDTVAAAVNSLMRSPYADLVFGDCEFIGPGGESLYTYRYPKYRWRSFVSMNYSTIPQPTAFWRRNVHEKVGYFDPNLRMCADFDFFAKVGESCRVERINRTLASFRVHSASLTALHHQRNSDEVNQVHARHVRWGKIQSWFLRFMLSAQVKFMNVPALIKKVRLSSWKTVLPLK